MTSRRPTARAALLALALVPALLPPPAGAQTGPVELAYIVDARDPALLQEGKVLVTWSASNLADRVSAFCLQTDGHEYEVEDLGPSEWVHRPTDVDAQAGRPACPNGYRALAEGADALQASFTLNVSRPAFSPCGCEFNSYLGPEWGVVKAEALAIPFSYSYFNEPGCPADATCPPPFRARVRFELPAGWSVEAPWTRTAEGFDIPGDPPLPRGFFALGQFTPEPHASGAVGKEFVYVRLAAELKDKDLLFGYLEKATPYYHSVYGNATGERILVVSAGAPMFTGGLGSTDSLFVHQNSTLDTIAHEYAHVWQRFQTRNQEGGSSLWVNEGDADLHGALSRFVTEVQAGLTIGKLNSDFRESYDESRANTTLQQPLSRATYGGLHEQVAYRKGLFTLIYMDSEIRNLTGGAAGLNDVLRELNRFFDEVVVKRPDPNAKRLSNEDVLAVTNQVVQRHASWDMLNFWRAFVWGNSTDPCSPGCWPPYRALQPEVPVVFDKLTVEPAEVEVGGQVTVRVLATNVRSGTETRDVELLVDEEPAGRRSVTVAPLGTAPVTFTVTAGAPGNHTARVAYLRETFRVLTPADLVVEDVRAAEPPQVGVAFPLVVELRNRGEAAAAATVDVAIAGQARATPVQVPGLGRAEAALSFAVAEEGPAPVEVAVRWGNRTLVASASLDVGPRDRDQDGVPDRDDGYPDNPRLAQKNVVNDLRQSVPGPDHLAAAGAVALAALAARRAPLRRP